MSHVIELVHNSHDVTDDTDIVGAFSEERLR